MTLNLLNRGPRHDPPESMRLGLMERPLIGGARMDVFQRRPGIRKVDIWLSEVLLRSPTLSAPPRRGHALSHIWTRRLRKQGAMQGVCALDFAGGSVSRTPGIVQSVAQAHVHLTVLRAPPPAPLE